MRIDEDEVEVFDLDAERLDHRKEALKSDGGLGQTWKMGTEVALDERPPGAELRLLVDPLEESDGHHFGIAGLLILEANLGRHLRGKGRLKHP